MSTRSVKKTMHIVSLFLIYIQILLLW